MKFRCASQRADEAKQGGVVNQAGGGLLFSSVYQAGLVASVGENVGTLPFDVAGVAVCIPASDEEERIAPTLHAALETLGPSDGIVLVVNGSRDRTWSIAETLLSTSAHPYVLIDLQWCDDRGSAPLARRIALDIGADLVPNGILVSLDADTQAAPGLRDAYAREFANGADLVCGGIDFDPEEAALLPDGDPELEFLVRESRAVSREIAALIYPDPTNPWPHHGNIGGANFAIRRSAYRAVGGLPTPDFGEDRALLKRAEAHGLRIRFSDGPRVTTSCRMTGKARGGLADELRRSHSEADPIMDEALEPSAVLELRMRTRSAFRASLDDRSRRLALASLAMSGEVLEEILTMPLPGEAWQRAEAASAALRRTRMRRSDLQRELPALIALRDQLRVDADDRS